MSLFKPEDGDYIVRGLLMLLGWWLFGTPLLIFAIALASGNGNVGVLGIPLSLVSGLVGYDQYLRFGAREADKESVKRMEAMIELRRIEREMIIDGQLRLVQLAKERLNRHGEL
jgi:hypothetical protein